MPSEAKLATLSSVALFKRLRKSREWLYQLCRALFEERGLKPAMASVHTSVSWMGRSLKSPVRPAPSGGFIIVCAGQRCGATTSNSVPLEGEGTGESLRQFPLAPGDHILADRGYCHASGIHFAAEQRSYLAVRLNPDGILLQTPAGDPFNLLQQLKPIQRMARLRFGMSWFHSRSDRPSWCGYVRFARARSLSPWPTSNSDAKPASRVRSCSPRPSSTPSM